MTAARARATPDGSCRVRTSAATAATRRRRPSASPPRDVRTIGDDGGGVGRDGRTTGHARSADDARRTAMITLTYGTLEEQVASPGGPLIAFTDAAR